MKESFCIYQERAISEDHERFYFVCSLYNKECPYNKITKAKKKCDGIISKKEE